MPWGCTLASAAVVAVAGTFESTKTVGNRREKEREKESKRERQREKGERATALAVAPIVKTDRDVSSTRPTNKNERHCILPSLLLRLPSLPFVSIGPT